MNVKIKNIIDEIFAEYHHPKYIGLDPLVCVHRFKERDDIEIVGLLASALAYGRVEIIVRSINTIIDVMDNEPAEFIRDTSYDKKVKLLGEFKHRFNDGVDIAALLQAIDTIMQQYGTLEKCFCQCMDMFINDNDGQFKAALTSFTNIIKDNGRAYCGDRQSFEYLIPSPAKGSACKRMVMFLRWMIRENDGIDLGVWKFIPTSCLLVPVDTHVAQIARHYGLTSRTAADWKMAEEITDALRELDRDDPVKYDFALCHAGMVEYRK